MDDIIHNLELRIHKLIEECEQLRGGNQKLRQIKGQLIREKELLLAKHKMAITQIESMVSRLKSIEKTQ